MEYDKERVDDVVLALLSLNLAEDERASKMFPAEALSRLHEKGYITDPAGLAKSVAFTKRGIERSQDLFHRMFARWS